MAENGLPSGTVQHHRIVVADEPTPADLIEEGEKATLSSTRAGRVAVTFSGICHAISNCDVHLNTPPNTDFSVPVEQWEKNAPSKVVELPADLTRRARQGKCTVLKGSRAVMVTELNGAESVFVTPFGEIVRNAKGAKRASTTEWEPVVPSVAAVDDVEVDHVSCTLKWHPPPLAADLYQRLCVAHAALSWLLTFRDSVGFEVGPLVLESEKALQAFLDTVLARGVVVPRHLNRSFSARVLGFVQEREKRFYVRLGVQFDLDVKGIELAEDKDGNLLAYEGADEGILNCMDKAVLDEIRAEADSWFERDDQRIAIVPKKAVDEWLAEERKQFEGFVQNEIPMNYAKFDLGSQLTESVPIDWTRVKDGLHGFLAEIIRSIATQITDRPGALSTGAWRDIGAHTNCLSRRIDPASNLTNRFYAALMWHLTPSDALFRLFIPEACLITDDGNLVRVAPISRAFAARDVAGGAVIGGKALPASTPVPLYTWYGYAPGCAPTLIRSESDPMLHGNSVDALTTSLAFFVASHALLHISSFPTTVQLCTTTVFAVFRIDRCFVDAHALSLNELELPSNLDAIRDICRRVLLRAYGADEADAKRLEDSVVKVDAKAYEASNPVAFMYYLRYPIAVVKRYLEQGHLDEVTNIGKLYERRLTRVTTDAKEAEAAATHIAPYFVANPEEITLKHNSGNICWLAAHMHAILAHQPAHGYYAALKHKPDTPWLNFMKDYITNPGGRKEALDRIRKGMNILVKPGVFGEADIFPDALVQWEGEPGCPYSAAYVSKSTGEPHYVAKLYTDAMPEEFACCPWGLAYESVFSKYGEDLIVPPSGELVIHNGDTVKWKLHGFIISDSEDHYKQGSHITFALNTTDKVVVDEADQLVIMDSMDSANRKCSVTNHPEGHGYKFVDASGNHVGIEVGRYYVLCKVQ
jgi:hypothetical protein